MFYIYTYLYIIYVRTVDGVSQANFKQSDSSNIETVTYSKVKKVLKHVNNSHLKH